MLARAPGLTAEHVRALFAATGDESSLQYPAHVLRQVGIPPAARAFLTAPDEAELSATCGGSRAAARSCILCTDTAYPPMLAQTSGAPPVLFVLGSVEALHSPQLAIVGSRHPTAAGRKAARDFAVSLARAGLTITSGLAVGVDAASHEGALLADGVTVAVLGTGLDTVYPSENSRSRLAFARKVRSCPSSRPVRNPQSATSRDAIASSAGFHTAPWSWRPRAGAAHSSRRDGQPNRGATYSQYRVLYIVRSRGAVTSSYATVRSSWKRPTMFSASCKYPCSDKGLCQRRPVGTALPHWTRSMKCC